MPSVGSAVRKFPVARLLLAAEVLLLARRHLVKLDARERRRVIELVRRGRLRRGRLTERERRELHRLINKMEPREFVNTASKKLVGVQVPGHLPGAVGWRRRSGSRRD
jgi:hypothetical protein